MIEKLNLNDEGNIEIKLIEKPKGLTLSMTGWLKDSGGQNYDTIYQKFIVGKPRYAKKAELKRLIEIWQRYHLNYMKAGTPKQMDVLRNKGLGHTEAVNYLKTFNLDVDNGYAYGSSWLLEEIPSEVIEELKTIIADW